MSDARSTGEQWEALTAERRPGAVARPELPTTEGLVARPGRGQVTLDWDPVDGAAGYLVRRAEAVDGPYEPLDIGEPWVRPVPHPPLTDTTGSPGRPAWYTVAAVAAVDDHGQAPSEPVEATPTTAGEAACRVVVDVATPTGSLDRPWRPIIGAERLSQLDHGAGPGDRPVGDEFAEALRLAHDELGVAAVRSHAILHDDLGVYREVDGQPVHDFTGVDRIYDRVVELGLRPIVEVSYMPRDLARDPEVTVFHYRAIISPPKDWSRWVDLVSDLTQHLVDRYGVEEVRGWGFEIWNEANLDVFWSGTREEYLHMYDISVRAVKAVDAGLLVGGPSSAAAAWIDDLLAHVEESGAPLDFLSTHTYGQAPLDLRPIAARYGRPDLRLWWTEWGAHATHFNRVHDSVWSAAYLTRGMVSAMGRLEALAYWTVSDHFEELGRPPSLLHGGFGLLAVGNLRKPRWWALWMLEQLRDERVDVRVEGDGAGDMVDAVATRGDGEVAVLVWNGTIDVSKATGDALLDRRVEIEVGGLGDGSWLVRHRRLDAEHSDIGAVWAGLADGRDWPDPDQWAALQEADRLVELEPPTTLTVTDGALRLAFDLPMPAVSLIELQPAAT